MIHRITCLSLALALLLGGCATTRQTRSVEKSGFLGDYAQLHPGEDGEAQLVYRRPDVDWSGYEGILLESIELWKTGPDSISEENGQQLANYFYLALHERLSKDFRLVQVPGPGVLRLRAALTETRGARVVGNAVTSIIPQTRLVATWLGATRDVQVFVGSASAEVDITDAFSGERLLAAVDARAGTKAMRGGIAKWSDVELACDYWAERIAERLGELGVRKAR